MTDKLFMSSGKIINSYQLLMEYYKLCREYTGRQCEPTPSTDDLRELERLIISGKMTTVSDILDYFEKKYYEKIFEKAAREACRNYFKVEVSVDYCKKEIARQVSGWLIEISENLGIFQLKPSWKSHGDFIEK